MHSGRNLPPSASLKKKGGKKEYDLRLTFRSQSATAACLAKKKWKKKKHDLSLCLGVGLTYLWLRPEATSVLRP